MSTTGNIVPGLALFSGKAEGRGAYVPPIDYAVAFSNGASSNDTTAPYVTLLSPTANVTAGSVGGFPREFNLAKDTPVCIRIGDLNPGLQYAIIVVRFVGADNTETEEVVYRRGQLRGLYRKYSSVSVLSDGVKLSIRRETGWPANANTNQVSQMIFSVDATDKAGNLDA